MAVLSTRLLSVLLGIFAVAFVCVDALASGYPYAFTGSSWYQFSNDGTQIRISTDSVKFVCGPYAADCINWQPPQMELWAFPVPFPMAGTTSEGPLPAGYKIASVDVPGLGVYQSVGVDSGYIHASAPLVAGTYYMSMVLVGQHRYSSGTLIYDAQNFYNTETWSAPPPPPPPESSTKVTVVEYYNAVFNHYFITPNATEISLLGKPPFQDWQPTGFTFKGYAPADAPVNAVGVCRFYNDHFLGISTHFYALHGLGCEQTISQFPDWTLEDSQLFYAYAPDSAGNCPVGSIPVYRLYNNGMGGAPNHRFTTSLSVRQAMLNIGYSPEGNGIGVTFCSPN